MYDFKTLNTLLLLTVSKPNAKAIFFFPAAIFYSHVFNILLCNSADTNT